MARLRVIEIMGGPFDGKRVLWDTDVECMALTDGPFLYQHFIDEISTGKGLKLVLRHVQTVPMPKRDQQ
jgi:hypothetical protein